MKEGISMRSNVIHAALRQVHETERGVRNPNGIGRAEAAQKAIAQHEMTEDERNVLLNAIHVSLAEVTGTRPAL